MKLAMIGFGQAGGKIVDKFLAYDERTGSGHVRAALAVNTARADLAGLDNIPESHRTLIGQARVKGHGVGADNELGSQIAEEDIDEIQRAIDEIPVHEIDAFLLVAGLGGGTGSGGIPVLAKHLQRIYTEPVYALGVLPGTDEGGIYSLNAARSFQTIVKEVDNFLVFDNDAWRQTGESVEGGYDAINEEIVTRFGLLFGAGEIGTGDVVAESVVDASEVINTLSGGGVSSVGYASESVTPKQGDGLLSQFRGDDDDAVDSVGATNRITSLVRKAALGRLTLPCNIDSVERALVVVAGPPTYLNRKGIERARKWLEQETGSMEVRGGDYPLPDAQQVSAAVVLSGVTDVPRIKELQAVAVEAQDNIDQLKQERATEAEALVEEDNDLDPLF